ncbi:MAG: PfkB family carbohydrate kinase [Phycisphaerales bacterium]|nr:PfkB family carbohydrate kinase [Phycisphaerales bacterium]
MTTLLDKVAGFSSFRALLVGDFMLDEIVHGDVGRLSPDAPVPVLHAQREERSPGGAAHVANCLKALGGEVICCGVVGDDESGRRLKASMEEAGLKTDGLIVDDQRPTTVKRSLVGLAQHRHPQKMFRLDFESREPLASEHEAALIAMIESQLDQVDVVCIEDYHKGVCTPRVCAAVIAAAKSAGKEVLVDPALLENYDKYRGATTITPNRTEAELATGGSDSPAEAATLLSTQLECEAVILTLDKDGAMVMARGESPVIVPTEARAVYDVTGAGDVVIAALTAARANGMGWVDSTRFANAAAGLEVAFFGTRPIPLAEVQRELLRREKPGADKVRNDEELAVELAVHRQADHRIVLTNGCFDVIHAGHVAYLRDAKNQGDVLVVGINVDEQVHAMKGEGRPVYALEDRMAILSELACVDYVIAFSEPTSHRLIESVMPDLFVKGGDYSPEEINEYELVKQLGIDCRVLAHRPGLGSTDVVEHLRRT